MRVECAGGSKHAICTEWHRCRCVDRSRAECVEVWYGQGHVVLQSMEICRSCVQRPMKYASASAVADHLGAMAAVVEVGAKLEHAGVTVGFTSAAAAAERVRRRDTAALRRHAGVGVARRRRLKWLCRRSMGSLSLQLQKT